jgi:phenylalanyl-tRNA synthetase beta chain
LDADFCAGTLEKLGCVVEKASEDWTVNIPGWRYDLTREADLIEEMARCKGMDTLPPTLPPMTFSLDRFGRQESQYSFLSKVKRWAAGLGLNEVVNYSFVGNKDLDHLGLPQAGRVAVLNPLTAEQDVLRTVLAPGLLNNVKLNISQGAGGLRLFEVAQSFHHAPEEETSVFEKRHLGIVLYGARFDSAWPHRASDMDYTDLKGLVEHFFRNFLRIELPEFAYSTEHSFLAPVVNLVWKGQTVGFMGRIKPHIADAYYARKPIWLAELELDALQTPAANAQTLFKTLHVYPPVRRDMTCVLPPEIRDSLRVEAIEAAIRGVKTPLLEHVELLDMYEPEKTGERNLTFRLTFRHAERTLQDAEVDREREKIASSLVQTLKVRV